MDRQPSAKSQQHRNYKQKWDLFGELATKLLEAAMTKNPNDFLKDGGSFYNTIPSMFGIFTYICLIYVVNVGYMVGMGTPSAQHLPTFLVVWARLLQGTKSFLPTSSKATNICSIFFAAKIR